MLPSASQNIAAYRQMAIRTASGGHLVLMLFDGALNFLITAEDGFEKESLAARNEAVSNNLVKAQNILAELQRTLDLENGGEFARTMYRLYDYMSQRLLEANMKKLRAPVSEVHGLLREVRDAWYEMLNGKTEAQ